MEAAEDNRKLISASTPLEVYAVLRRRERAGDIKPEDAASALSVLRHGVGAHGAAAAESGGA